MFRAFHRIVFVLAFAAAAVGWRDELYPTETARERFTNRYSLAWTETNEPPLHQEGGWLGVWGFKTNASGEKVFTNYVSFWPNYITPSWNALSDSNKWTGTVYLLDALDIDAWMAVNVRERYRNPINDFEVWLFRNPTSTVPRRYNNRAPLHEVKRWFATNLFWFVDTNYTASTETLASWWSAPREWQWVTNSQVTSECGTTNYYETYWTQNAWEFRVPYYWPQPTISSICANAGLPYEIRDLGTNYWPGFGWEAGETNWYTVNNGYPPYNMTAWVKRVVKNDYFEWTPWRGLDGTGPLDTNMYYVMETNYAPDPIPACAPGFEANDYTYKNFRAMVSNFTYMALPLTFWPESTGVCRFAEFGRDWTNEPQYCAYIMGDSYTQADGCAVYPYNSTGVCEAFSAMLEALPSVEDARPIVEAAYASSASNCLCGNYSRQITLAHRIYVQYLGLGFRIWPQKYARAQSALPSRYYVEIPNFKHETTGDLRWIVFGTRRQETLRFKCPPTLLETNNYCSYGLYNGITRTGPGPAYVLEVNAAVTSRQVLAVDPEPSGMRTDIEWNIPAGVSLDQEFLWSYSEDLDRVFGIFRIPEEWR